MEKQLVTLAPEAALTSVDGWLDLDAVASVTLTSEDPSHPIESALGNSTDGGGWRAAQPGPQTIWLHFDQRQDIEQIHVRFEAEERRTQEFVLLSSSNDGVSYREIVRQQFNFSPGGARQQEENYFPRLMGVTDLKLAITPDISGGEARATLQALRIR